VAKGERMTLRVQLSYELDPHYGSDAAEEILIALREALPRIEGQALLRSFVAHITQGRRFAEDDDEARFCSFIRARREPDG